MGLDTVEILVEVENTLGISFTNEVASNVYTVGDFHEAAWKLIKNKSETTDKCFTQITFYKLRQNFKEILNVDSDVFRPELELESVFPTINRRHLWSQLQNSIGLKLPNLELGATLNTILFTFGGLAIFGSLIVSIGLINWFDGSYLFLLIPIIGSFLTYLLAFLLTPFKIKFSTETIRDLTEKTLELNFAKLSLDNGISKKDVEIVINQIISDKGGIHMKDITKEKSITNDLGLN
jgi:acyl carrier protein